MNLQRLLSRDRIYGNAISISSSGIDPEEMNRAYDLLARNFEETWRALHYRGVELDIDTYDVVTSQPASADPMGMTTITWSCRGRQTRNLIQRLIWAAQL